MFLHRFIARFIPVDEMKQEFAEISRKNTILSLNERALTRKVQFVTDNKINTTPFFGIMQLREFSLLLHRILQKIIINNKENSFLSRLLAESEQLLRKECSRARNDVMEMEASVRQRINYLERFKETSIYKLESLTNALANSVPKEDFDSAVTKCDAVAARFGAFASIITIDNAFVIVTMIIIHRSFFYFVHTYDISAIIILSLRRLDIVTCCSKSQT